MIALYQARKNYERTSHSLQPTQHAKSAGIHQTSSNWSQDFGAAPRVCRWQQLALVDVSTDCLWRVAVARRSPTWNRRPGHSGWTIHENPWEHQ